MPSGRSTGRDNQGYFAIVDFELIAEQAMLREASRDLLTDRASVALLRTQLDDDAEVEPRLWQLAGELGWTGLLVG